MVWRWLAAEGAQVNLGVGELRQIDVDHCLDKPSARTEVFEPVDHQRRCHFPVEDVKGRERPSGYVSAKDYLIPMGRVANIL